MLNSSDIEGGEHYPISQFGMTLVEDSGIATSSQNIVLPNALNYEHVEWNGDVISIHHSNGITTTNFSEISSLWTFESLEEKEILNRFNSLTNSVEAPHQEIEKYLASSIEDDFFGHLQLNKELDWYEVTRDNIEFSFTNTTLAQLTENLRKTERLIPILDNIEEAMIEEMLILKNQGWLADGETELSRDQFKKKIKIYGINIYEGGDLEIYYKANDLFWGHEIQTTLDHEHVYENSIIVG